MPTGSDTDLQRLIDISLAGDDTAREALIAHASERLLLLTRKMFHGFPRLRRFEQTDDVFQDAMIQLRRALEEVKVVSVRDFFKLAAHKIRQKLLDLKKHWFGPEGVGANHHSDGQPADNEGGALHSSAEEPDDIDGWTEFHAQVEELPEPEREVVNLLYYEGLTKKEAAKVMGVSLSGVKRNWISAKLKLREALKGDGQV